MYFARHTITYFIWSILGKTIQKSWIHFLEENKIPRRKCEQKEPLKLFQTLYGLGVKHQILAQYFKNRSSPRSKDYTVTQWPLCTGYGSISSVSITQWENLKKTV